MRTQRLAVGGAVLAVLLVAGGGLAVRGAAEQIRTDEDPPPRELTVACAADAITVSGREVAAGPGGVTLNVSSSIPAGSYLTYDAPGHGTDEPLPASADEWVRPIPPGQVELACATDGRTRPRMSTQVEVVDPEGHWRDNTPGDAGCTMTGGQPSWKFGPESGATAQEAVATLIAEMTADSGRSYATTDAGLGYPQATTQTWVALDGNGGGFTIDVTRTEAGFEAGPNYLCGGLGKPPAQ